MSPAPKERVADVRRTIRDVLGSNTSDLFLKRVDRFIDDWAAGKITAAEACEKIQKIVSLFIDEQKAREIGQKCAPFVMRESVEIKK